MQAKVPASVRVLSKLFRRLMLVKLLAAPEQARCNSSAHMRTPAGKATSNISLRSS